MNNKKDYIIDDVVTGLWGCGGFRAYPQIKFFIQWLACSLPSKKMVFYYCNEKKLNGIDEIVRKF